MTLPSRMPPSRRDIPAWAARDQLSATHLRFDAIDRDPTAHAAMLRRLGITRVIWDRFSDDPGTRVGTIDALRREGIALEGIWVPHLLPDLGESDYQARFGAIPYALRTLLDTVTRRGLSPDVWMPIAFSPPGAPPTLTAHQHAVEVERAADHLTASVRLAHGHGLCVVLTNQGGWAGEPRTMRDIVDALARRGLRNVGVALQLQHAQHHVADLDSILALLGESLVAVVISGVDAGAELSGRVILPFGAGSRDRWVAHALVDSAWHGRVVVHATGHDDAEARLADSIEGLEWALGRIAGDRSPRPAPRVLEPTWPPGWAWRTDAATPPTPGVRPPKSPLPTPYGQPEPRREHARVDAALAFLKGSHGANRPASPTSSGSAAAPLRAEQRPPGLAAARAFLPRRRRASLLHALATDPARGGRTDGSARADSENAGPRAAATDRATEAAPLTAASPIAEATARPAPEASTDRVPRTRISTHAPDPYTGALHALLTHLRGVGFTGAPRSFGWDDQGRHLLEFMPGTRLDDPRAPASALDSRRIGRFVREMHDALEGFVPPADARWFAGLPAPGHDLIVHQDLVPSNLVIREDGTLAAIDWDASAPGTRLWELAHVAHTFAPLYSADSDLRGSMERLRGLADGYGLGEEAREQLVPLLAERSARMYDYLEAMRRTGEQPWVALWERGIGTVWRRDAAWIRTHEPQWRHSLLSRTPQHAG
ncbi:phosphotransferase [Demequina capsici]|uniref:Phosphotransferase n=1 Tax=Demequina capsici TaxID=3075620 RepID=A0AA96F8Q0_9MICO|nr:phosphotransferase [Demequina sp. OYTSA14]WNM24715.1 phosphotransferase [Demequina sp. OYTSA14]